MAENVQPPKSKRIGRECTPETRAKIAAVHKGRRHTPEARAKMSAALKGKPKPWQKGKKRGETSPEVREKISKARKGQPSPMKGKKRTPEFNAKVSASKKGRPAWNKGLKMASWSEERREKFYAALARPYSPNGNGKLGISLEDHVRLFELQQGSCAICGVVGKLHIDHDHVTGAVRGLLCGLHNRGLGMFANDPVLLTKAIKYLAQPPAQEFGLIARLDSNPKV